MAVKRSIHWRAPLAAAITAAVLSQGAFAQTLEEVIVTAQKRAESLSDVPVSVAAIDGEKLQDAGIGDLSGVSDYIPNFTVQRGSLGDLINIRGIQSGIQAGFEQSVGTFVDGVYRGRSVQSRYAFMDVGMVEVLRGPQGTLFGKNTVAGALNVTSARPTDEFESQIVYNYNYDQEESKIFGYVSGPLSENVRARLALQNLEMEKGWVKNVSTGEDIPTTDEQSGRLIIDWDLSDATMLSFRAEYGQWDNHSLPFEIINGTGGAVDQLYYGGDTSLDGNVAISQTNIVTGMQDAVLTDHADSPQDFFGDSSEASITMEHTFSNNSMLTVIGAISDYRFERYLDADFNQLGMVRFDELEDFSQNSLEVRFASDTGGAIEYITGIYYQDASLQASGLSYFSIDTIAGLGIGGCGAPGLNEAAYGSMTSADAGMAYTCYLAAAGYQTGMSADENGIHSGAIPGLNRYASLDQDSETMAAFASVTWNISDSLAVTAGLRYTDETKDASQSVNAASYAYGATSDAGLPASYIGLAESLGEFDTHDFDGLSRHEQDWTYSLNVEWHMSDTVMNYATVSTGSKAGGYNSFYMGGTQAKPEDVDFEGESVTAYEVGTKMQLLDGRAELNMAYFFTDYEDMQSAVFSGNTTYEVRNAASATSQGIEIDGRFMVTDDFMLTGAVGWTDFEFDSFPEQACTGQQFIDWRQEQWDAMLADTGSAPFGAITLLNNAACSADSVNDLAGRAGANTPEFSATVSANYYQDFSSVNLAYALDVIYQDEQYRADDLDPVTLIDAAIYLNGSIRMTTFDDRLSVALIGNNLTDENNITFATDAPLQTGAQYALANPGRSLTMSLGWKF